MTLRVSIKVAANEPRPANFQLENQMGSGKDAFWSPAEIGSIMPGEEREFTLYKGRRIILDE